MDILVLNTPVTLSKLNYFIYIYIQSSLKKIKINIQRITRAIFVILYNDKYI